MSGSVGEGRRDLAMDGRPLSTRGEAWIWKAIRNFCLGCTWVGRGKRNEISVISSLILLLLLLFQPFLSPLPSPLSPPLLLLFLPFSSSSSFFLFFSFSFFSKTTLIHHSSTSKDLHSILRTPRSSPEQLPTLPCQCGGSPGTPTLCSSPGSILGAPPFSQHGKWKRSRVQTGCPGKPRYLSCSSLDFG